MAAAEGTALAKVAALLEERSYDRLGSALDEAELEEPSALSSEQWPHALHLLAHIYAGRLEDARFLYKRTPDAAKAASPELQAAFALLQRVWCKDYQHIWPALQFGWSEQVQPLAAALGERLRGRMLDLVSRAYGTISPAKLGALLGCSAEEAAAAAAARGWAVVEGLVEVRPPAPGSGTGDAAAQRSLQRLAEYVVHLEAEEHKKLEEPVTVNLESEHERVEDPEVPMLSSLFDKHSAPGEPMSKEEADAEVDRLKKMAPQVQ
ncbi:COP9 signalosome complex subunit 8 [Chlorella sorokiniana]|uniref:COP9 signalosome complex subunit 8 n=1 Tax=Chlorella sorokiniana TaxID=3076 RepID=A0A2P6TPN8_CHLSO|nr:COP9 signalosome complex subunit 8 [Chlorella sorokiniana]|eukprot:PRW56002.1 COP9 signalosome complex subunit 8 [Chlorella sorokiniana]